MFDKKLNVPDNGDRILVDPITVSPLWQWVVFIIIMGLFAIGCYETRLADIQKELYNSCLTNEAKK